MSASHRGVILLTIITIIFAPMLSGHHKVEWFYKREVTHKKVACKTGHPCPKTKTETHRKYLKKRPAKKVKKHTVKADSTSLTVPARVTLTSAVR